MFNRQIELQKKVDAPSHKLSFRGAKQNHGNECIKEIFDYFPIPPTS